MNKIIEINQELINQLNSISTEIGNTPLFDFSELIENNNFSVKLLAKIEWNQIGGSVKARAAYGIIKSAIQNNELNLEKELLDASSGNTAIAYAVIANKIGIKTTIILPENASQKRKDILTKLGVNVIYSSPFEGTDGAQILAKELKLKYPEKYFYANQYNNEANWKEHFQTTGPEIWKQTDGKITHFAASLGTTGTFVGTSRYLLENNPNIKIIQMQPNKALHGLEGWKHLETAKIPGIFDKNLAHKNIEVDSEKAIQFIKVVYEKFDVKLSPSAAASLMGALSIANNLKNGIVVTVLADDGTKYEEIYSNLGI